MIHKSYKIIFKKIINTVNYRCAKKKKKKLNISYLFQKKKRN
jgi:hypothetical protein